MKIEESSFFFVFRAGFVREGDAEEGVPGDLKMATCSPRGCFTTQNVEGM